jgi:hypothetical protein
MNKGIAIGFLILTVFGMLFYACSPPGKHERNNQARRKHTDTPKTSPVMRESKIAKAVFYLENSESMFGYVNGITAYVDVVSELSEKPEFVAHNTKREFFLINGGNELKINKLGNNPVVFKSKLNSQGFHCGDITKSNLNAMLQIALENARNDTVTLLISDAIYDIGLPGSPLNALATEGKETRSKFITRLVKGDLQTIMIKLTSDFNGNYFYSSHGGKVYLNQPRPFYIWIFGKTELLNKYFPEDYISSLNGFENYARFLVIKENNVPYQIIPSFNRKGTFKPDRKLKNKITDAKPDRNGRGFQFCFAVDYSSLPFSESYLTSVENYSCNLNYSVISIEQIKDSQKYVVTSFKNPTHIITVYTEKNPFGELEVVLKNEIPGWIEAAHTGTEDQIDNSRTFGFKHLTDAISGAYTFKNNQKNLTNFKIVISN